MKIAYRAALAALLLVAGTRAYAEIPDGEFEKAIEKYLGSEKGREKLGQAFQTYMQEARSKMQKQRDDAEAKEMEDQFKNPVKIDLGSSPFKGPKDAKVTIVEFSDFQCPYCRAGASTVEGLLKDYGTSVRVVFKNFPLVSIHPQAEPAARAALAAHKQGKFWEMHDELFANQGALKESLYTDLAKKIGIDVEKFKTDYASEEIKKAVEADMAVAESVGIQGTPGFAVNGVMVRGNYPPAHFKKIIDRWLGKDAPTQKS